MQIKLTAYRDRSNPIGYKLSAIAFSSGSPIQNSDSTTSTVDILTNIDLSNCPNDCFRPVGLALDSKERLFMTSDSTGEIYVLVKTGGGTTTGTPTSSSPTASTTNAGVSVITPEKSATFALGLALIASLILSV